MNTPGPRSGATQAHPPRSPLLGFQLTELVRRCIEEDLGQVGDITTACTVPDDVYGSGNIVAREPLVVSGLAVALEVFAQVHPAIVATPIASDADALQRGQAILRVEGPLAAILTAERPALNFLGRLSGIATHTRQFIAAVADASAKVVDTRKTTPGHRALEKAAIRDGGGHNHRFGLFDGILIKDNHGVACGGIPQAVARAKANRPHHLVKIGVEVDRLDQIEAALEAGAEHLLLDNMDNDTLRAAVKLVRGRASTEASGGVKVGNIGEIAKTGVDFISSGSLIHGARWVDLALDFDPLQGG